MDLEKDRGCFVCGPDNAKGLRAFFTCDKELKQSFCRLTIEEHFQGWHSIVHGGVIASLLDEACIYAGRALADNLVTAELSLRYRKPVPVGQEVIVRGQVLEQRRKVLKVVATLELAGEPYAEAEGRLFLVD